MKDYIGRQYYMTKKDYMQVAQIINSMRGGRYCLIPHKHPAYRVYPGLPVIPA